jgi:hypothetical protein
MVAQRLDAGDEAQTALALDVGLAPLSLANDFTLAVACCLELGDQNLPARLGGGRSLHGPASHDAGDGAREEERRRPNRASKGAAAATRARGCHC